MTTTSGRSARHSASSRSTSAPCTAGEKSFGRSGVSSVMAPGCSAHAPYTVALDTRTTFRTPTSAAAASTRRVPSTFTRAISDSSGIGSTTPARCTTTSTPSSTGRRSVPAMSTRWNSSFVERCDRLPHVERDDTVDVRVVRRAAAAARCPTRPEAPVTAMEGTFIHWPRGRRSSTRRP